MPVFATNSANVTHEKQLPTYSEIQLQNTTKILNESMKGLHSVFIQNNFLKEDIKEMCSDMNKERVIRNDIQTEIEKLRDKKTRVDILSSINQINSNSSKIKSLINQNEQLKKEIQELEEKNEKQEIASTKNQIIKNSSEISVLINQNKDLIKEIDTNT